MNDKREISKKKVVEKRVNLGGYHHWKSGKFVGPYKRKIKQYPNKYVTKRIDPKTGEMRWVEVTRSRGKISIRYLDPKLRGTPEYPITLEQAKKAFERRPLKSKVADLNARAKKVYPPDQITSAYTKNPGRKDVEGIDTPPKKQDKKIIEVPDKKIQEIKKQIEEIKETKKEANTYDEIKRKRNLVAMVHMGRTDPITLEENVKDSKALVEFLRKMQKDEKAWDQKIIQNEIDKELERQKELETALERQKEKEEKPQKKELETQKDKEKKIKDLDFERKTDNLQDILSEFQKVNEILYNPEGLDDKQIERLKQRRNSLLEQRKKLKGEKEGLYKFVNRNKGIAVSETSKDKYIVQFDYNAYNSKPYDFKDKWRDCAWWNKDLKYWTVRPGKQKDALTLLKNENFIDTVPAISKSLKELYLTEQEQKNKNIVVIEIDDELKVGKFEGDPSLLKKINDFYSYYAKGYKFNKKYKEGTWDGKARIISMQNRTLPKNLAYNILDEKEKIDPNLEVKIVDFRENAIRKDKFNLKDIQLYDYQQDAITKAIEEKQGLIVVATGGGKTEIASGIVAEYGEDNDTIFLVHTTALQDQAEERLEKRLGVDVGVGGGSRHDIKKTAKGDINVVTLQSLHDAVKAKEDGEELTEKQKELLDAYKDSEVVIQDEAHHVKAETFKKVIDDSETKHLYGLTATPYRDENDEKEVFSRFGKQIINISPDTLIEKGRLVPPTIKIVSVPPRREAINASMLIPSHLGAKRYMAIKKEQIMNNEPRNKMIVQIAKNQEKKGKTNIIFVDRIDHGEILAKMLDRPFLNGQNLTKKNREKNKKVVNEVAEGKVKTIIATQQLFGEGFDLPAIDSLIVADAGGQSRVKTMQRAGRALRTKKGKEYTEIYDFNDQIEYLEDHTSERIQTYKENEKFKVKELSEKELQEELNI